MECKAWTVLTFSYQALHTNVLSSTLLHADKKMHSIVLIDKSNNALKKHNYIFTLFVQLNIFIKVTQK
jgi:hypothetical protein